MVYGVCVCLCVCGRGGEIGTQLKEKEEGGREKWEGGRTFYILHGIWTLFQFGRYHTVSSVARRVCVRSV